MKTRQVVFFLTCLLLLGSAGAQELTKQQELEMLDCTFHRRGTWVDRKLHADGNARFTYLYEPSKTSEPSTLYVVFWNPRQTEGKLIVFHVSRTAEQHDLFGIVNDGWIRSNQGRLDLYDALGGIYEYQQFKSRLPKLKKRPVSVVALEQLRRTSAVCTSPLDK